MSLRARYRRLTFWNKFAFWGGVATIVGLIVSVASILLPPLTAPRERAAAAKTLACFLLPEIKLNMATMERIGRIALEAAAAPVPASTADPADRNRFIRMLRGESFLRTSFQAHSSQLGVLPDDLPDRVPYLYATLDLCEKQKERLAAEMEVELNPDHRMEYGKQIILSCDVLDELLKAHKKELSDLCGE